MDLNKKYKPLWTDNYDYAIITGGRGCFLSGQKVVTSKGIKPIELVNIGDKVKSYNLKIKQNEYKTVTNTFKYNNEKYLKITLKNGDIIKVTENHKFYYKGGWIRIKDLVSLLNERKLETTTIRP